MNVLDGLAEHLAVAVEDPLLLPGVLGELSDLHRERGQRLGLVADDLAEEEVQALDRGCALVESVDLGVADILLDRVVLQVARPAERLQRFGAEEDPGPLGPEALDQRQQQVVRPRGEVLTSMSVVHNGVEICTV